MNLFENLQKMHESNNYREPIKCLQNNKGDIINIYKDKETGRLRAEGDIPGESFNGPWDDEHEKYYKSRGFKEIKESYDDSLYDDFPYDPYQESDPEDYYNEIIDGDEPDEYTVELYKTHNDVQPIRKRFDNIIDAENFAKNNTNGYSEVFISSSSFNGPSVINSWSKETGWYHELNESIEEEESGLKVCSHCLAGIESKEGKQNIVNTYEFDSYDEDAKPLICEWCDEEVDKLYEIDNTK